MTRKWLTVAMCLSLACATHVWAQADAAPDDAPPADAAPLAGDAVDPGEPGVDDAPPQDNEEEAAKLFDQLFGEAVKRAMATRDPADDVDLANTLLDAARSLDDQPNLTRQLLDTVYALGSRSIEGLDTAVLAMRLLAEKQPRHAAEARDRIILVYSRKYAAARTPDDKTKAAKQLVSVMVQAAEAARASGDHNGALTMYRRALPIAARVDADLRDQVRNTADNLTQRMRVEEKVKLAKKRLQDNPEDKAAGAEIINLYVVELNDPVEARKYTFLTDEANAEMIKLAAADPDTLEEPQYLRLGEWYRTKADTATGPAHAAMHARVQLYLQRYLRLHTQQDLVRTKAQLMLKQSEDRLARLGTPGPPPVTLAANTTVSGTSVTGTFIARKIIPKLVPLRKGGKPELLRPLENAISRKNVDEVKKLVKDGVVLNPASNAPLREAVRLEGEGAAEIVEALLAGGADPNQVDRDGRTALHQACYYGARGSRAVVVEALIQYGAKIDVVYSRRYTPLYYAVYRSDRNTAAVLRANGATSNHPLHDAARVQDIAWAKEALAGGADVNEEFDRTTPLGFAVMRAGPDATAMARFLLDAGANPNPSVGRHDLSPVQAAAYRADRDTYDLLIKKGATSATPLHDAASLGDLVMARKALAANADPNEADRQIYTPLMRVALSPQPEPAMVGLLINAGADPDKRDNYGRSALYHAMTRGNQYLPVAVALVENGAPPGKATRGNDRHFPLQTAMSNGGPWHELALLLIDKGADIDAVDGYKTTALHYAVRRGEDWLPVVKKLIDKGAKLDMPDRRGRTPLGYAEYYRNEPAAALLKAAGAK